MKLIHGSASIYLVYIRILLRLILSLNDRLHCEKLVILLLFAVSVRFLWSLAVIYVHISSSLWRNNRRSSSFESSMMRLLLLLTNYGFGSWENIEINSSVFYLLGGRYSLFECMFSRLTLNWLNGWRNKGVPLLILLHRVSTCSLGPFQLLEHLERAKIH